MVENILNEIGSVGPITPGAVAPNPAMPAPGVNPAAVTNMLAGGGADEGKKITQMRDLFPNDPEVFGVKGKDPVTQQQEIISQLKKLSDEGEKKPWEQEIATMRAENKAGMAQIAQMVSAAISNN